MFSGNTCNRVALFDALNAVQISGDPMVCPSISLLGDLETAVNEVKMRQLRMAAFPGGSIAILPPIPVGEEELCVICEKYCRARSDEERAKIRYDLYLRDYPLHSMQLKSQNTLYHPADCVIRVAELCVKVLRLHATDLTMLMGSSAYLQMDQIRLLCENLQRKLNANDLHSSTNHANFCQPLEQPMCHTPRSLSYGDGANAASVQAGVEIASLEALDKTMLDEPLAGADEEEEKDVGEMEENEEEDLTGTEKVDSAPPEAEYLSEKDFELVTESSFFFHGEGDNKRLAAVYITNGVDTTLCKAASAVLEPAATQRNRRATTNGGTPPYTGIVGYYDYLNHPTQYKCRATKFLRDNWSQIANNCPKFLQTLDDLYRHYAPMHYNLQRIVIPSQFELFNTVFSTMTVNRNFRTAVHTDRGDFRSGLAALCVVDGNFQGCHLAIKKLKKSFRLNVGDVLFFDTSFEHGNTEVLNPDSDWKRISVVCYLRSGLLPSGCELEQNKHLHRLFLQRLRSIEGGNPFVNLNAAFANRSPMFVPTRLVNTLAPVQLAALDFVAERVRKKSGCVLAMTMGLGKTLIALTFCFAFHRSNPYHDILIIAPKPIICHWLNEQRKWKNFGLFFKNVVASDREEPRALEESLHRFDRQLSGHETREGHLFILNPEYFMSSFARRFKQFQPKLIIIDEGHRIATKGNKLIDMMERYDCPLRIILSGTPLQNDAKDLYHIISWTNPEVKRVLPERLFDGLAADMNRYVTGDDSFFKSACAAQEFILEWMKSFVFREMEVDLAPLHDYILICGNSKTQGLLQEELCLESEGQSLKANEHRPYYISAHPLCYFAYMCGAYHSFTGLPIKRERTEEPMNTPKSDNFILDEISEVQRYYDLVQEDKLDQFIGLSGKLTVLIKVMLQIQQKKEKAIIFSQYLGVQDIIHRTLTAFRIPAYTIRGRDAQDRRQQAFRLFSIDPQMTALVLSTKIAAFGLDFTMANHVILFESWWNPQVDAQAVARAYRRNQTKPVTVYRLSSHLEGSTVLKMQMRKIALFNSIMYEKTSRRARMDEVEDCANAEPNPARRQLWQLLKATPLEGGTPALQGVYLYRDAVKDTSDIDLKTNS